MYIIYSADIKIIYSYPEKENLGIMHVCGLYHSLIKREVIV